MKNARASFLFFFILTIISFAGVAQKKKTTAVKKPAATKATNAKTKPAAAPTKEEKRDEAEDVAKVKDMVAFLEYVLNTLGSSSTSPRDKEVLITQSYSKIFRDAKVQVEDDLDDEREVPTNKDIVAYLKDVDFFFDDVKFEFTVDEIKSGTNANDKTFYKVSLKRNLKGTTTEGKVINNTIVRYIEINYDPVAQDLKIVSIYTHEVNPKDAMINWWNSLSLEWKDIFRKKINGGDSISFEDIKTINALIAIDLSHNQYIQNIDPLSRLTALQTINLSGTSLADIGAVRNMTSLTDVDLSSTNVKDLTPLKYSDKVTKLNLHHTPVSDISVLQKMPALQWLDLSQTAITDISALETLTALQTLSIGGTAVTDLSPLHDDIQITDLSLAASGVQVITTLQGFKSLQSLNLDSTKVNSLAPLNESSGLKILRINKTDVADLTPVSKLPALQKIYCDNSRIKRETADAFASINPKVIIILDSDSMKSWWESLSAEWKGVLTKAAGINSSPTMEDLARVPAIDSINLNSNAAIKDIAPVKKLLKLRVLIASKTSIQDLSPLEDHILMRYLDISETEVTDIGVVKDLTALKILRADKSKIEKIDALFNLVSLQVVYMDETALHDITAREFLEKNHACLLIYKTIHLNRWWRKLPNEWKLALGKSMGSDTSATRENLHRLAELETLTIKDAPVRDLSALSEFVRIKNLDFSGTGITDLTPLASLATLRSLHATNGPVEKIEVLNSLSALEDLDLSNTPIDDLKAIASLENLTKFNCSGTQIKRLDHLEKLQHVEFLDCSNTKVGNVDPVMYLPLKTFKCYNTRISERAIDKFKKQNPSCSVVYYR